MPKTKNTNCLYGIQCPKCGSLEPFVTIARVVIEVRDDGTDTISDVDFEEGASWRCCSCRHEDTVGGFLTDTPPGK